MKKRFSYLLKLIFMFIVFFKLSSLLVFILGKFKITISLTDYADMGIYSSALEIIIALLIYLLYHNELIEDFKKLKTDPNFKKNLFKYFVLFMIIKFGSGILETIVATILKVNLETSENQSLINNIANYTPWILLITSTFFTPIAEEGIFRLGIRKVIKNDYLFILLSGFIFGLMHIFPTTLAIKTVIVEAIPYVVMGVTLGYIYYKSDNIWNTIIIHGINNCLGLLAIILMA